MHRTLRAWSIVTLLMIFMLINFLDKVVLGMVAVPLMMELHLSPHEFGLLGGSFFWLFAFSGIVFGCIANRASPKSMLLMMALSWALFQLPMYFSSSLAIILLCRVMLGIGEGPAWAISVHSIYQWFPNDQRALPVSILAQGAMAGLLIAGALIPFITHLHGWRANFLLLAIAGLVWAILWQLLGADGRLDDKPATVQQPASYETIPYRKLLRNKTVIALMTMHFAFYWSFAVVLTWLPAYLNKGLGFSPVVAGRWFSYFVLVNIPVNLLLSFVTQRLSANGYSSRLARGVFTGAALLAGGVLLFVPAVLPVTSVVKITAMAISFGAITLIVSLGPAILGEVSPPSQRAGLIAIDTAVASVAGALAPLLMGWVIEWGVGRMGVAAAYEWGFVFAGSLLAFAGLLGICFVDPEAAIAALRKHVVVKTPASQSYLPPCPE